MIMFDIPKMSIFAVGMLLKRGSVSICSSQCAEQFYCKTQTDSGLYSTVSFKQDDDFRVVIWRRGGERDDIGV